MFKILKNGRRATTRLFPTYELARQHVRKLIRKVTETRHAGQPTTPMWLLGYEIRQVT